MSVATDTDLWSMSATALAGAIRSKQASCREVIQADLRRIEAQLIERAGAATAAVDARPSSAMRVLSRSTPGYGCSGPR